MKKPPEGIYGEGNFFKNTLRRLSSKKLEKLRSEQSSDPTCKGYGHAYWAFSKSDLNQTLSLSMNDTDEQQALEVFHLILQYAGLLLTKVSYFLKEIILDCPIGKIYLQSRLLSFRDLYLRFNVASIKFLQKKCSYTKYRYSFQAQCGN